MSPNLQHEIERFVDNWAPDQDRRAFIHALRRLMNLYAEAAIAHGAIPEAGVPHGSGRRPEQQQ